MPVTNNANSLVPAGWPRHPKFNQPGDVPCPPVQWGDTITKSTVETGFGYTGAVEELDRYFTIPTISAAAAS
ncbi:MAG: hypothetical protein QM786_17920 [Breznakibacter sp.]